MSLHVVLQQEYSCVHQNRPMYKFINVCLLIRGVEDFSVCIGVVNLCVILHVNDAVIRFLRTLCLPLYNTLYFDGQNQQKWQACFCSI